MPEYYVKLAAEEAQGPFNLEQLKTLVAAGKVTPQTPHFYDDETGWQLIQDNPQLNAQLFSPGSSASTIAAEKPKLQLKKAQPTSPPPGRKAPKTTNKTINVEDMLAVSETGTPATRHLTKQKRWGERTAALSLPLMALLELLMGALLVAANWGSFMQLMTQGDFKALAFAPALAIGICTFVVGVALMLSVTAVYPAARYLALILMGYMSIQAWSYLYEGLPEGWVLLGVGLGFGLGIYTLTLTLNFVFFALATIAATLGALAFGWFTFL